MRAALLLLVACSSSSTAPTATTGSTTPTPPKATSKSRVENKSFHSDALGVDKEVVVYLPAGYDESAKRYPVFYYLHGLGGNETNWIKGGHIDEEADKLALDAIIVMPDGDNNFYFDGPMPQDYDACIASGKGMFSMLQSREHTCVKTSKYGTYIQHDLVAWTDASYRTIAKREGRGIAGLSMGGYGSLVMGMKFPDTFAAAASHSGVDALLIKGPIPYPAGHPEKAELYTSVEHWGGDAGGIVEWIRTVYGPDLATWRANDPAVLAQTIEPGKVAFYLDCGTEDDFALQHGATYLHDVLASRKIEHAFFLGPGRHDFEFWRPRLPHSLTFLRDHVAKP